MKVAVLVVSRNRPDLVEALAGWLARNAKLDYDLFVVEAGTDSDKLTRHTTLHYADTEFRGKCLAHNLALEHAREQGRMGLPYDYSLVLQLQKCFAHRHAGDIHLGSDFVVHQAILQADLTAVHSLPQQCIDLLANVLPG